MIICQKNFYYAQKLQKQAYDKGAKPMSYVLDNKVGWIASISKPNKTRSWRPSSLDRFECYIQ